MKRTISVIALLILSYTIFTNALNAQDTLLPIARENESFKTSNVDRAIKSNNINNTKIYKFYIGENLNGYYDTFEVLNNLEITANDNQEYKLYYSKNENYNLDDIKPITFTTYLNENSKNGYYTITAKNYMDISISVN